jgi:hypothetical protein
MTGATVQRDVPCTPEQLSRWECGVVIQDAMPDVSPEDREFVLSGMTPEVWAQTVGVEQDEELEVLPDDPDHDTSLPGSVH